MAEPQPVHDEIVRLLHEGSDVSLERARRLIRQEIAKDPHSAELHDAHGLALAQLGHLDEAIVAARVAVALAPQSAVFVHNLGHHLLKAGNAEEAAKAFEQEVKLAPQGPQGYGHLIVALAMRGDQPQALEPLPQLISQLLALRPTDRLTRQQMALGAAAVGQVERLLQTAVELWRDFAQGRGGPWPERLPQVPEFFIRESFAGMTLIRPHDPPLPLDDVVLFARELLEEGASRERVLHLVGGYISSLEDSPEEEAALVRKALEAHAEGGYITYVPEGIKDA